MAHFYGTISGRMGGSASRVGTQSTGLSGHLRGWDVGARVDMRHEDGVDVVYVWATGGNNATVGDVLIARYTAATVLTDVRTGRKVMR